MAKNARGLLSLRTSGLAQFATAGGIIEINLIALVNDAMRTKEVIEVDFPEMATWGPHLKVDEFCRRLV